MKKSTKSTLTTMFWGALGLALAYGGFRVYRLLPDVEYSEIWEPEHVYSRGAVVYRHGNWYRAITPSTNVDPSGPRGSTAWRPGKEPLLWNTETRYETNDQVTYQGQRYRFAASAPSSGVAPDATIADNPWRRL